MYVCMYVGMYVRMRICMYVCIFKYVCSRVHDRTYMCVNAGAFAHIGVYASDYLLTHMLSSARVYQLRKSTKLIKANGEPNAQHATTVAQNINNTQLFASHNIPLFQHFLSPLVISISESIDVYF